MDNTFPLKASSKEEFEQKIDNINSYVPERGKGKDKRKTYHTERWIIKKFLRIYCDRNIMKLEFPLEIIYRDRPDFLIKMRNNEIGIEVTECISTRFAKFLEKQEGNAIFIPNDAETAKHEQAYLESCRLDNPAFLDSPGWSGEEIRQNWLLEMEKTIKNKYKKFKKPGFKKFNENYIVIYDNTKENIFIAHFLESLVAELEERLYSELESGLIDRIFILTTNYSIIII